MRETQLLSAQVCARVSQRVLPVPAGVTPGDLRAQVQRAVLQADPEGARQRHEAARDERATWVKPAPEAKALQGSLFTAVQGKRFEADLTALLGRTTAAPGDDRTVMQRRTDLLADLPALALELLDRYAGVLPPLGVPSVIDRYVGEVPLPPTARRRRRRRAQLVVQVPVCTMVGLSAEPVYLEGYGWVTGDQVTALLTEAGRW